MSRFMSGLANEANEYDLVRTENGALGYRTTMNPILDINFKVSSFRGASELQIARAFQEALAFDREMALRWLFFVRDVRGGLGERRLFRTAMADVIKLNSKLGVPLLKLFPEYGRWDDLVALIGYNKVADVHIHRIIATQLSADIKAMKKGEPITLLGKWLPSVNASPKTRAVAVKLCSALGLSEREYRKTLVALRKYTNVVETYMSANKWHAIDYSKVPSRANVIYKDAFLKHDSHRRKEFLDKVERGEAKINSGVNFPHDIVSKYAYGYSCRYDQALEALWKALPNISTGDNTLVVADCSGSMSSTIPGTSISAMNVSHAMAIYFAEHATGAYANKAILFSSRPQYIDFSKDDNLIKKIIRLRNFGDCSNTDIKKTMMLILDTAVRGKLLQEELPKSIVIISDMEFDEGTTRSGKTLFKTIADKFIEKGYTMPRIVFWNVCSRTGAIPMTQNDRGVALVSGFSVNIVNMVMSGKLDPYECLKEQLMKERYNPVAEAIKESGV